jgi:hypothetical protein
VLRLRYIGAVNFLHPHPTLRHSSHPVGVGLGAGLVAGPEAAWWAALGCAQVDPKFRQGAHMNFPDDEAPSGTGIPKDGRSPTVPTSPPRCSASRSASKGASKACRSALLTYPMLIRRLVEAGRGLLIDPYLRLEQLLHVRTHTSITRVLISAKLKREDREAMAVLVKSGAVGADGPIDLRVAGKDVLHDRLIVGEGFIDTIGTSLNTVGRQHPTVLSPLPSPAANTMREQAEKWWADAEPLAAWPPPEADTSTKSTKSSRAQQAARKTHGWPGESHDAPVRRLWRPAEG